MAYDPNLNRSYNSFNANDIMSWITDEVNEIIMQTDDILEETAEYAVQRVAALSPKGRPRSKKRMMLKRYAESWKIRMAKPRDYKVAVGYKFNIAHAATRVIYNTQGKLTHVLEHGTDMRQTEKGYNRGKIDDAGLRHIQNAYLDAVQYLEQLL